MEFGARSLRVEYTTKGIYLVTRLGIKKMPDRVSTSRGRASPKREVGFLPRWVSAPMSGLLDPGVKRLDRHVSILMCAKRFRAEC